MKLVHFAKMQGFFLLGFSEERSKHNREISKLLRRKCEGTVSVSGHGRLPLKIDTVPRSLFG